MVASHLKSILALATLAVFSVDTSSAQQTAVPVTAVPATAVPAATSVPDDGWGGCVDPTDPDAKLELGKKTTICVTLSSSAEWNIPPPAARTLRLSFQPDADEYSRFHVPSSYQDLIAEKSTSIFDGLNNVTIHVASQKVLSFQRMFFTPNAGAGRLFPYLTAIIDVTKGVVTGITWDDACLFCANDMCVENTYDFNGNMGTQSEYKQPTKGCYIQQPECVAATIASAAATADAGGATGDPHPCDILVYVVWTGDDKNGKALQSSAFRFSAFPEQELSTRLADSLPDLPSFLGGDEEDANDGA